MLLGSGRRASRGGGRAARGAARRGRGGTTLLTRHFDGCMFDIPES